MLAEPLPNHWFCTENYRSRVNDNHNISKNTKSIFYIEINRFQKFFLMFILEFWQVFIVFKDFLFYFYVQIGFVCSFRVQIRTNIIKILIKNCIREKVCRAESGLTWCTRQCRRQQRPPRPPYTRDWSLSDHLMDDMEHSLTRTFSPHPPYTRGS